MTKGPTYGDPTRHPRPSDADLERMITEAEERVGGKVCGYWITKKGRPCESRILMPNGRCRVHAGKAPKGVDNPAYRHGGYVEALPDPLGAIFERLDEAEIHRLSQDIRLITTRVYLLLDRLQGNDPTHLWAELREQKRKADTAQSIEEQAQAVQRLFRLIDEGGERLERDGVIWGEVMEAVEVRSRLVEKETKRRKDLKVMLAVDEVLQMLRFVESSIKRHLSALPPNTRDSILANISGDFRRLVAGSTRGLA